MRFGAPYAIMPRKKPASIYTAFRISPELRQAAREKAKCQGRSFSNYVKRLIALDVGWSTAENEPEYRARRSPERSPPEDSKPKKRRPAA